MKKLAVLMPTYNCAKYLQESIDSILNQTYSEFDFYIYDDCSTDNTSQIISGYSDERVIYIKNSENLGIAKTLNLGLEKLLPLYQYIARMDADDWAFPERFQRQIDFMDKNSGLALCGTQGFWLKNIIENPLSGWEYPVKNNYLKLHLLFAASFAHSSVVLRSAFFVCNNLKYNEYIKTCEDWDLWTRVYANGIIHNLPDFLMKYRIVETSNHRSSENKIVHLKERSVIISNYWKTFNIHLSPQQVFEYYYESDVSSKHDFQSKLKVLIDCFNQLFLDNATNLESEDKRKFSYLLARKILDFWKRSNNSRYHPIIWYIVVTNVKFINLTRLIKSQLN
jgi:glycosyltransferase involved in cell wall biosynthesis